MDAIEIPRIYDMHQHARQGEAGVEFVRHIDAVCDYALLMPNTKAGDGCPGPITTAERLRWYRDYIENQCGMKTCKPIYTIYLQETTTPAMVREAVEAGATGFKIYPRGQTTHSDDGIGSRVLDDENHPFWNAVGEIANLGAVLNHHAEIPQADCYNAERMYVGIVRWLARRFPNLRQVVEHVTTKEMVQVVEELYHQGRPVAGSITVHHLYLRLNDVVGQTHNYCMPIAKGRPDQHALIGAATGGLPCFFFGSDAAPHEAGLKRSEPTRAACAGCWTTPVMAPMLWELFCDNHSLQLPGFVAHNAAAFYRLPVSDRKLSLVRETWTVPERFPAGGVEYPVWMGGQKLNWKVVG